MEYFFWFFLIILMVIICTSILLLIKDFFDEKNYEKEQKEVEKEIDKLIDTLAVDESNDIFKLMLRNVMESREYYTINKQHARKTFSAALIVSFLGFFLFGMGVIIAYLEEKSNGVLVYSAISGALVEIISGLFFWLYSQSLKQLNVLHKSLRKTERLLTAVQLVDNVSHQNKDSIYEIIIKSIIDFADIEKDGDVFFATKLGARKN